jgi:putative ABC transport system permease protein
MGKTLQDIRSAARVLTRQPGLTLAALLTLALGIGGNTAIFSLVESSLINPLRHCDTDGLVYLYHYNPQMGITTTSSPEFIRACRDHADSFEEIGVYSTSSFNVTGSGEPALITGARVEPRLFSFLGVKPSLGRAFVPGDEERWVAVLSHQLWRSRFGGDAGAIGQRLIIDDEPHEIVGVLPAGFDLDAYGDIRFWLPGRPLAPVAGTQPSDPLHSIARLAPGVSPEAAQAELDLVGESLQSDQAAGLEWVPRLETPQQGLDPRLRRALLLLQVAVGFVLLIACANIANLLLAQGEGRAREMAMRSALGASRGRLARQILTESLALGVLGGALGLGLACWAMEAIPTLLPEDLGHIALNWYHLGFTLVVALLSGLVFGLVPALRSSTPDLISNLKHSAPTTASVRQRVAFRHLLVVAEVALALMLLVGAGLLARSFIGLQSLDPGFEPRGLLTLRIELPEERYPEASAQVTFFEQLLERARSRLGERVESIALASGVAADFGAIGGRPEPEGRVLDAEEPRQLLIAVSATPGYFRTVGIPLHEGRGFGDQDSEGSEPVVIINHTLARRYFSGESPVGRRIRFTDTWYRVIGVAGDSRLPSLAVQGVGELQVYFPFRRNPSPEMTIAVRTTADHGPVVDALKACLWDLDSSVPVTRVATADTLVADSLSKQRFNALLMALFAAIAAVLTTVGIYGVVAYSVSTRTREIGIRLALGATRAEVLRQAVKRGMTVVVLGLVLGLVGALSLARILVGLVHDVSVTDPATFISVSLLVAVIALLATWLPARRAAHLDPVIALRHE